MDEKEMAQRIMELSSRLDPNRQSLCWPDPIVWDGRPLEEQLQDLEKILEAKKER